MILKIFLEPQKTQLPKLTGGKSIAGCITFPIQTIQQGYINQNSMALA